MYRGADLRRSPAFRTSGHFVPKSVIIDILACVLEQKKNPMIKSSSSFIKSRRRK